MRVDKDVNFFAINTSVNRIQIDEDLKEAT
jgi:hypothetical protein